MSGKPEEDNYNHETATMNKSQENTILTPQPTPKRPQRWVGFSGFRWCYSVWCIYLSIRPLELDNVILNSIRLTKFPFKGPENLQKRPCMLLKFLLTRSLHQCLKLVPLYLPWRSQTFHCPPWVMFPSLRRLSVQMIAERSSSIALHRTPKFLSSLARLKGAFTRQCRRIRSGCIWRTSTVSM